MTEPTHAIKAKNIWVSYDETPVLRDLSVTLPKGKLTAIIGPNGAGKSTLIEALLGFIQVDSGELIYEDNQSKDQAMKSISYVPQKQAVDWNFPATVFDVVLMGRYGKGGFFNRINQEDKDIAMEKLKVVSMEDFADRQINQLSGGQKQRVFLARALASEPDTFLLDEPLAGVDMKTEKIIMSLLRELTQSGKTVVLVHHDLHTVRDYFDNVVFLNHTVLAQGPVETTFTEENIDRTYRKAQIQEGETFDWPLRIPIKWLYLPNCGFRDLHSWCHQWPGRNLCHLA